MIRAAKMVLIVFGLNFLVLMGGMAYLFFTKQLTKEKLQLIKAAYDEKVITIEEASWWKETKYIPEKENIPKRERELAKITKDILDSKDKLERTNRTENKQVENVRKSIVTLLNEYRESARTGAEEIRKFWTEYAKLRDHLRSNGFTKMVKRLLKLPPVEAFDILKNISDDREVALVISAMKKEKSEAAILYMFMTSNEADPTAGKARGGQEGYVPPTIAERGKKIYEILSEGDMKIPVPSGIPSLEYLDNILKENSWFTEKPETPEKDDDKSTEGEE